MNKRKFIKRIDIFGKPVSLKFDKEWDTHHTKVGGFATIIIIICVSM
jgi:hypothetical protein